MLTPFTVLYCTSVYVHCQPEFMFIQFIYYLLMFNYTRRSKLRQRWTAILRFIFWINWRSKLCQRWTV